MTSLLARGIDFLSARLASAAEEMVRVDRPSTQEVILEMPAAPGSQDFLVTDNETTSLAYKTYDWLVAAENYDFGAGQVEPADEDRITVVRGAKTEVYEVLREPGIKSWRFSDPYNTRYRIHTKLVSRT